MHGLYRVHLIIAAASLYFLVYAAFAVVVVATRSAVDPPKALGGIVEVPFVMF